MPKNPVVAVRLPPQDIAFLAIVQKDNDLDSQGASIRYCLELARGNYYGSFGQMGRIPSLEKEPKPNG